LQTIYSTSIQKGFRGEALASIAAIAHVEMKTRQISDELGTPYLLKVVFLSLKM